MKRLTLSAAHLSPPAGRGRIALAIRVRGSLRKRGGNRFKHARHVAQHVVVPESQDTVVMIDKPFVANHVVRIVCVLPSVHLNHQTKLTANKVDRIRTDRLLSDEFVPVQRTRSKASPQSGLCVRSGPAQTPGTPGFDLIGSAHAATPPHPDCFAIRPLPARGERLAPPAIQ